MRKTYFLILWICLMNGFLTIGLSRADETCVGIKVYPDHPFRLDFFIDPGEAKVDQDQIKPDSQRLIRYFLTSITIPEQDLWVNLSPYEKNRITPNLFGQTEMGRDLLAQDYELKQLTAEMLAPNHPNGKKFWEQVKREDSGAMYQTVNKVWIVPGKVTIYENAKSKTAVILDSHLKVLVQEDLDGNQPADKNQSQVLKIFRQTILPALENEVNASARFAKLREVYHSLILAAWYKMKMKGGLLQQIYSDRSRIGGVDLVGSQEKFKIYDQYVAALKSGVYNAIVEDDDEWSDEGTPRKYFSGGMTMLHVAEQIEMMSDQNAGSAVYERAVTKLGQAKYVVSSLLTVAEEQYKATLMKGMQTAQRSLLALMISITFAHGADFEERVFADGYRTHLGFVNSGETVPDVITQYLQFHGEVLSHEDFQSVAARLSEPYRPLLNGGVFFAEKTLDLRKISLFLQALKILRTAEIMAKRVVVVDGKPLTIYFLNQEMGARAYTYDDIIFVSMPEVRRSVRETIANLARFPKSFRGQLYQKERGALEYASILQLDLMNVLGHEVSHGVTVEEISSGKVKIIKTNSPEEFAQAIEIPALLGGILGSHAEKIRLAELIVLSRSENKLEVHRRHIDGALNVSIPILERLGYIDFLQKKAKERGMNPEVLKRDFQLGLMDDQDLIEFFDTVSNQDVYEATEKVFDQLFMRPFRFPQDFEIPAEVLQEETASASVTQKEQDFTKGGIDFNLQKLNLQIEDFGHSHKFNLDPAYFDQLQNIPGFTPVVVGIEAFKNPSEILK